MDLFNVCSRCHVRICGECPGAPYSQMMSVGERRGSLLGSASCRRARFRDAGDCLEIRIAFVYSIPWRMIATREAAGAMCDRLLTRRWFMVEDRLGFLRAVYEHWGWDGPGQILVDLSFEREV